jgi:hypothetical protein
MANPEMFHSAGGQLQRSRNGRLGKADQSSGGTMELLGQIVISTSNMLVSVMF